MSYPGQPQYKTPRGFCVFPHFLSFPPRWGEAFSDHRFLAIESCVRESTQRWREVLLNFKSRGLNVPKLAISDGAMGF